MSGQVLFHMWDPYRQSLIEGHRFYVEQARKRLLSQFGDIEREASAAADAWLDNHKMHFDPDRHDPGDFYEAAQGEGIAFYELLSDMEQRTRLSVVAGMFHEWDKQLRDWLVGEIRHWHVRDVVVAKVWTADFAGIADLLEGFGWMLRSTSFFSKLDECRLVVNVYKHGTGKAFTELRQTHPEYLRGPFDDTELEWRLDFKDHTHLSVSDQQVEEFSNCIVEFWMQLPERIFETNKTALPAWFVKAIASEQR